MLKQLIKNIKHVHNVNIAMRNNTKKNQKRIDERFKHCMPFFWNYKQRVHFCKKFQTQYADFKDKQIDTGFLGCASIPCLEKFDKSYCPNMSTRDMILHPTFHMAVSDIVPCLPNLNSYYVCKLDDILENMFGDDAFVDVSDADFVAHPERIKDDISAVIKLDKQDKHDHQLALNLPVSNIPPTNSNFKAKGLVESSSVGELRLQAVQNGANMLVNVHHSATPSSFLVAGHNVYTGTAIYINKKNNK